MKDFDKQIKALQAEKEAVIQMTQDWPAGVPQPSLVVWHNSTLCEFGLTYKASSLDDVKGIIGSWWNHPQTEILPLRLVRDGSVSFRTPMHDAKGEIKAVFPVTLGVSKYGLDFEFYALFSGHLVRVSIEIDRAWSQYANVRYYQYRKHTRVSEVRIEAPAFTGYQFIRWWSDPHTPNSYTLYWEDATSLDDIFSEAFQGF